MIKLGIICRNLWHGKVGEALQKAEEIEDYSEEHREIKNKSIDMKNQKPLIIMPINFVPIFQIIEISLLITVTVITMEKPLPPILLSQPSIM